MMQGIGFGFRRLVAVLAVGGAVLLTGCGEFFYPVTGGTTPTGSSTYVYVTNIGSGGVGGTLSAYTLTSGVLAAVSGSPISLPAVPTSVVVAPNNAFLYVATNLGVFMYTIASGGVLTEGNNSTIVYQGPSFPQALAVDSTSSWLLIANNNSTELDALPVDPTSGIPTTNTPAAVTLSSATPAGLAISPANGSVAVALGTGGTNVWAFNAANSNPWGNTRNGILLNSSKTYPGTSTNAVAFDTTSTYLFLAESSTNNSADDLRKLTLASISSPETDYPVGKVPSAILADLSGTYVYVSNNTNNTISGFSLSAGALTALTDSPYGTAKSPLGLVEDSTKSYLLSIGNGNNPNLWVYSFDATSLGSLDVANTNSTASTNPSLSNSIAVSH
ncbi:beta-propeller fold lactonase family protein [Acidicapsa ligni]|uniref:beta-propeller fold lactonase family protein n=1 Tax=Acidicapsa ligni TaxID=542300 RepID=UPI0021E06136|nr:beta-propeller fold lactonase family protein [Acidicapsa ligni]